MKAVVATFNQEKALVGAFSVITKFRMELFEALTSTLLAGRGVAQHRQQADVIPVSRHAKVRTAQEDRGQAPPPARLLSVGILHRLCVHEHISHLNEEFLLNTEG